MGYASAMNLKTLHAQLLRDERAALAVAAGIKPEYLYQLATGFKGNPSMKMCAAMVAHDSRLTFEELAEEFGAPTPATEKA